MPWRTISAAAQRMHGSCGPSWALPGPREEADMSTNHLASRRDVLRGGALIVSFSLLRLPTGVLAQTAPVGRPLTLNAVDSFLAIDPKGMVTVYSGKVDLGTGVETALAQIVAEELDVPLTSVTVIQGDTALTPDQGPTSGSFAIQTRGVQIRNAAAAARSALLERATAKLGVEPEGLAGANGVIQGWGEKSSVYMPYGGESF